MEERKDFPTCPACGSTNRFFESLAKELKDRGLTRKEWTFYLDIKEGVVVDKTREAAIPIGSKVPSYIYATDICADCGNIYAIWIVRGEASKSVEQVKNIPGPIVHGN